MPGFEGTYDLRNQSQKRTRVKKTKTLEFPLTGKPEVSGKLVPGFIKLGSRGFPLRHAWKIWARNFPAAAFLETDGNYEQDAFFWRAPVISFCC